MSPQFQPSDDRGASIQPAGSRTWLTPVHWRVQNRLKACSSNTWTEFIRHLEGRIYLSTGLVLCVENARGSYNKGSVVNVILIWFPDFVRRLGFRKKIFFLDSVASTDGTDSLYRNVANYQSTLRSITEDRRSDFRQGENLEWQKFGRSVTGSIYTHRWKVWMPLLRMWSAWAQLFMSGSVSAVDFCT